jgi:hypothetical protein
MPELDRSQPHIAPGWTLAEIWSLVPSSRTLDHRAGKTASGERAVFEFRTIPYHPATRQMPLAKCESPFRYCSCEEQLSRNTAGGPIRGKTKHKEKRSEQAYSNRIDRQFMPLQPRVRAGFGLFSRHAEI